jgi:alpha-tubulin suppressor-like RCC1 family protein
MDLPQMVKMDQRVVEILAGDCHGLCKVLDGEIYAWGQGNLASQGESTEVISNIPVQLIGGYHNTMEFDYIGEIMEDLKLQ